MQKSKNTTLNLSRFVERSKLDPEVSIATSGPSRSRASGDAAFGRCSPMSPHAAAPHPVQPPATPDGGTLASARVPGATGTRSSRGARPTPGPGGHAPGARAARAPATPSPRPGGPRAHGPAPPGSLPPFCMPRRFVAAPGPGGGAASPAQLAVGLGAAPGGRVLCEAAPPSRHGGSGCPLAHRRHQGTSPAGRQAGGGAPRPGAVHAAGARGRP